MNEDTKMDISTRNLGQYVRNRGIKITKMVKSIGIPYGALYDSLLSIKRERDLRLGEALTVCDFLGVDSMDSADKEVVDKKVILLHKPHPEDEMDKGAVSSLIDYLKDIGEL